MGLGLALVRHIIRRCGSEVRIESQPAHGTRVILTLCPARYQLTVDRPFFRTCG